MIFSKVLPISFLALGIIILMQVILPLLSFQLWLLGQNYNQDSLVAPIIREGQVLGVSVQKENNFPYFVSDKKREVQVPYQKFQISVEKLKIKGMEVFVDSNDLNLGLVHLPGSSLPGERGNVFISGHSSLSPLFSFKKAPFANLTDLKKGDKIEVEANGAKFKYVVEELKVVDPADLSVINPPDSQGRYITLMTCVPPGLNLKRLIVLGKMI